MEYGCGGGGGGGYEGVFGGGVDFGEGVRRRWSFEGTGKGEIGVCCFSRWQGGGGGSGRAPEVSRVCCRTYMRAGIAGRREGEFCCPGRGFPFVERAEEIFVHERQRPRVRLTHVERFQILTPPRKVTHPDRRLQMAGMDSYHPDPFQPPVDSRSYDALLPVHLFSMGYRWCFGVSNQLTSQRRNPPRSRGMIPNVAFQGANRGGRQDIWTTARQRDMSLARVGVR